MRIDIHAHHHPRAYLEWLSRMDAGAGSDPPAPHPWDLDARLEQLAGAGIDLQVLSLGARQPTTSDPAQALDGARIANDGFAEVVARYGGCYRAFGSVPLPHVDSALAEAARCLDELGMLGIGLGCAVQHQPLDDPEFEPFWSELNRRQAVAFLHPIWRDPDPHITQYNLSRMVGGCFEDAVAALRLVQSGLTTRFPEIRFVVPHLGGMLPFVFTRLDAENGWRRRLGIGGGAVEDVGPALRHLYFDVVNGFAPALRCAGDAFGTNHLVFGTDYPFASMQSGVEYVQQAGLTLTEVDAIFHTTSERLLRL